MKDMATVYLHIGTMKTGTSALQRFLHENREYLKSQGYIYPKMNEGLPVSYIFRNGHFIVYLLEGHKEIDESVDKQKVLKNSFDQIETLAKQFEHIILSDELIWHYSVRNPVFWTDLSEKLRKMGCELKVIVYLRRQDAFIESLYSHAIKSNHKFSGDFKDYLDGRAIKYFVLDYYKNIKNIESQIGKDHLIIRTYEKERFVKNKNGIFSDFLETVGLSLDDNYVMQKTGKNSGMEGNYLEFKRIMNGLPQYREVGNFMARPLALASAVNTEGQIRQKDAFFTVEERKEFLKKYEEGNRKLAEEYFGNKDGSLFSEVIEELPIWQLDRENLWKDLIISMTEEFCIHEKRIMSLEKEVRELEKERKHIWFYKIYQKIKKRLSEK